MSEPSRNRKRKERSVDEEVGFAVEEKSGLLRPFGSRTPVAEMEGELRDCQSKSAKPAGIHSVEAVEVSAGVLVVVVCGGDRDGIGEEKDVYTCP